MATSDVQLDTGINVGRAQVFKPLDVQELFDAKQRKKAADELAKANKLKEQEAKKAKVKAEVADYGALKAHREKLDVMAKEILAMTEANPDNPEIATKIYNYAVAGRAAQDVKKAYDDMQKTLYKDTEKLIYGEDELEDAIAEESELSAQPDFDVVTSTQRLGEKIQNVKAVDREKYAEFLAKMAKDTGETTTETMDANLSSYKRKEVLEDKKKSMWESLKANYVVSNGVKQLQKDDGLSREEALAKIKQTWDGLFDEATKFTLDKTEAKKDFKFSSGSGSAANDNWSLKLYPNEVDIQKIAPSGYNEVMAVEVFDKDGKKVNVEGTPVKYKKTSKSKGSYTAIVAVPVKDYSGKQVGTDFLETTDKGYGAVTTKVGLNPYELERGIKGYKTVSKAATGTVKEKPKAKKYKFTKVYNGATYGRDKETDSWKKITQ